MRLSFVTVVAAMLAASIARADVERFAVIAGNSRGVEGDGALSYATDDATRVYDVLCDLGSFRPANMVKLIDENAETLRQTLLSINERVRAAMSQPNTQVVLFLYYSGHADADDLHLAGTRFPLAEFAQMVRGSAASFRLVVLDACRSGALTRVKGGSIKPAFPLPEETLPGDGVAFLTASAVSEDAQESDELRGSFFTHALVSGMLGAADDDRDGRVVLNEAYRYAYQHTLRATSRSPNGLQHPTFRYDLRGQGDLVLTRLDDRAAERANLTFPEGIGFLLMRDHADGPVVAEVSERSAIRTLSVRAGRYFVRGRGADVLYEGPVDAPAGGATTIQRTSLHRIEYAKLVRKGQGGPTIAHAIEVGGRVRSILPNTDRACLGGYLGYGVDFAEFGARMRLSMCTSGFQNGALHANTNAYDLDARVHRAWDLGLLSVELGLGGGTSLFTQSFEVRGTAPARQSLVPFLMVGGTASVDIKHGVYASLDVAAETHFVAVQRETIEHDVNFAMRVSLGVGKRF